MESIIKLPYNYQLARYATNMRRLTSMLVNLGKIIHSIALFVI